MISELLTPQFRRINVLPFYLSSVRAGFPSPADDYIEQTLDLNEYLVAHPAATFYVRVKGHSMRNAGIFPNDILIVDRALDPKPNRIVVAILNGEFTVKRFTKEGGRIILRAENTDFAPIIITEDMEFEIWGVVVHVIHHV